MEVKTELKLSYLQETKEAIKNAIISKGQAVADTDTFRSYAEKIAAIETDSASSVTEVFPETELPFVLNPDYGMYLWSAAPATFSLAEGKEYVVVWDGTAYTCTAKSAVFITSAGVGVGNFAMAGIGDNTGEPFLLGVTADGSAVLCFTTETDESHTVRIYQKASAGGGSGVEVCYVTFMSEDGVTELYKKAVIPGDNCMNPVEMGWLNAPAKNPTNTEVFTFDGWSATAGGSADASALLNVTEDRTVYAAFEASTRYYTVRFFDGEELKHTMQVTYNATAEYTLEKDGMNFGGWNPSNANITADTDCYAVWIETVSFATSSMEAINAVCEAGKAADYFSVGDTRTVTYNSTDYAMKIVGINLDTKQLSANDEPTGKAGLTIAYYPLDVSRTASIANAGATNNIPTEIQNYMKTVKKETGLTKYTGRRTTYQKIFSPSLAELGETGAYSSGVEETIRYPGLDGVENRIFSNPSLGPVGWWTRTPVVSSTDVTYYIDKTGNYTGVNVNNTTKQYALRLFCI